MDFRILGPVAALDGARDVAPRRAKARALLALLLINANQRVGTDRIIEALWGESPPNTADKALQGHVSTLRKLLGPERILTERSGYRLEIEPGELDVDRFAAGVAAARSSTDPVERTGRLGDALAIWRGEPLADVADERFAQPEIARLAALRLAALELRAEAELALGHHAALVPELEQLVEQHPLSEGLRAKLMTALYRSGRQSEALRAYHDGRRLLAEDLGIDPGTELQQLERRILDHDPALAAPPSNGVAPAPPRQERKTVTILVVEVGGASPVDPEDLASALEPTIERARAAIERHGGTAEPLFANGLLGIFGAPRAYDDDALRGVRAALELCAATDDGAPQVRVGAETGPALVTVDGARVSVTGEVLGTASRLQLAAERGSVALGVTTHRLTEESIEYRAVGPGIWAPLGPRERSSEAPPETAFVGRVEELDLLEQLFERARDERSVQLVTIMAEPGGGKSRLLRELRARLQPSTSITWLQGQCLPYGDGVTYWALGEIVKDHAAILESDDAETSGAKVAEAVHRLESDDARRAWLERNLGALVGSGQSPVAYDRDQAFAAWRHYLESLAGQAPLVVVFEDIHWADAAFLDFLDHVVSHASGVPLMVVCTARLELLESHPSWAGGKRNATTIALEPLSPTETEALLRALTHAAPEPETIRRASGNPLFAHELARIAEASPSMAPASVPESLQAVIAAHLDALAPELKAIASDAAVVGEVFWPGAVASMAAVDEREVESRLHRLIAHDVARRRRPSSVARQSEYAFLHVLVRDVAYWHIPRRARIAKHRAVGEWIEGLAGDHPTRHAELIAHHYVQALDLARGLDEGDDVRELTPRARAFLILAGEGARTIDIAQAESFYRRALDLTDETDAARGRLLSRLGEAAELTGRLSEAEGLSTEAIVELRAHDDLLGAGEAMVSLVATLWRLGRPEEERRRVAEGAIQLLEQVPPGPALVRAYSRMATHELHAGRADACGTWSRRALTLADQLGVAALKVQPLHHLGIARFESGDEAGIDDIREAVRIGLEAGLSSEVATAQSNLAATIWVTAGPVAALEVKQAAAAFAASRGLVSFERTIRAESLWQQFDGGAWDNALASADQLLGAGADGGSSRVSMMAQTVKARILAERGLTEAAAELERVYLPRARELRDPQDLGPALAAAAARQQALGDVAGAAALIAELERVTRGRDPSQRVHELPHAARVCLAAGTISVARALIPTRRAPTYTRARLCLASAQAIVAEASGDLVGAADLHRTAADGWRTFGCPAEEAHARMGHGRCLLAAGNTEGPTTSLRRAQRIGRALGAVLIVAEASELLASAGGGGARPKAIRA